MSASGYQRFRKGARIGGDLTVLGTVAKVRGRHPVYIVWSHSAWAPMACKVFRSLRHAEQEAAVLAAVAHPNIVRPLGVREPALMLMEFLDGPTLSQVLTDRPDGRMPLSDGLRAAIHLGAALQQVHAKGFLHLDIKPGNAIVSNGRPILFDFGTVRRQDEERRPVLTGTDPYMAPEECELRPSTPAADVFSFGATVYELLTGALPFPEGTRRMPHPQLTLPPTPMRTRRASIPRALDELVLSALARDPAERPSLASLLTGLHAHVRGPRMWPQTLRPEAPPISRGARTVVELQGARRAA